LSKFNILYQQIKEFLKIQNIPNNVAETANIVQNTRAVLELLTKINSPVVVLPEINASLDSLYSEYSKIFNEATIKFLRAKPQSDEIAKFLVEDTFMLTINSNMC
jgi:transcriptional regulator